MKDCKNPNTPVKEILGARIIKDFSIISEIRILKNKKAVTFITSQNAFNRRVLKK